MVRIVSSPLVAADGGGVRVLEDLECLVIMIFDSSFNYRRFELMFDQPWKASKERVLGKNNGVILFILN